MWQEFRAFIMTRIGQLRVFYNFFMTITILLAKYWVNGAYVLGEDTSLLLQSETFTRSHKNRHSILINMKMQSHCKQIELCLVERSSILNPFSSRWSCTLLFLNKFFISCIYILHFCPYSNEDTYRVAFMLWQWNYPRYNKIYCQQLSSHDSSNAVVSSADMHTQTFPCVNEFVST